MIKDEYNSISRDMIYEPCEYESMKQDYGRINTLLTFSHLISVLLNRRSLAKFAGSFARPPSGMAPIPKTKAHEFLPLLSLDFPKSLSRI